MSDITLQPASPTGMELLADLARNSDDPTVAVAIAKSAVDLQIQMERFTWEREERQSKIDFDNALSAVQKQIGRIAADKLNGGVRGGTTMYLTYAKLDRIVRPLYTEAGFSISFGEEDCPTAGKIRVVAHVSRGGVTRQFIKDITPPLLGPKGEPVMTATHGDASANSYARRYLIYDIFNIAVGIDKDDDDGNGGEPTMEGWKDREKAIAEAPDTEALKAVYIDSVKAAKNAYDKIASDRFVAAKNQRWAELGGQ